MAARAGLLAVVCLLAALAQPASGSGHVPRTDASVNAEFSTSSLQSVSCASAGNCAAVGGYADSSGGEGLLLSEQDGVWGDGVEARLPADAAWGPAASRKPWRQVFLSSVSCPAAGECVAVGEYQTRSGFERGLILTETGGVWQTGIVAPVPANTGGESTLRSVSCPSVGNCAAVGTYRLTSDHHSSLEGLLVTEHGETWFGYKAVLPADAHSSSNAGKPYSWTPQKVALESVSCPSAGNCAAVGEYKDVLSRPGQSDSQGVLLNETDGVWEQGVEAVPPANAWAQQPRVGLHSVSCPSAGDCVAVGVYLTYDSEGSFSTWPGLLLTESNGSWQPGVAQRGVGPPTSVPFVDYLPSVSCASPGECVAAGYDAGSPLWEAVPLLVVESGGDWLDGLQGPLPADTRNAGLASISCPSAGSCAAVGTGRGVRGLLLSESGGSWSVSEATLPADAAANPSVGLNWLSCPSSGNCAVVGQYVSASGQQGLLLSESGGAWGTGVQPLLPPSVDTRITALGVKARTARISVLGVGRTLPLSFECRLDGQPFATCAPTHDASRGAAAFPVRFAHLAKGKHRFEVEAIDGQGTVDRTPAVARFRVR